MNDREHLYTAWTEALPFAAESAFSRALLVLDRAHAPDRANQALRDELREWLRTRSRGASIDNTALLQNRAWWIDAPDRSDQRQLADYLCALSSRYLECSGSSVGLAPPWRLSTLAERGSPTDAASLAGRWRWLSLALPQDSLVAARCAHRDSPSIDPPADRAELLPVVSTRLLEDPCAETHLHIGASTSFTQLWSAWIGLGIERFIAAPRNRNGPWPLGGYERFSSLATSAALVRLLLAAFLQQRATRGLSIDLREFVRQEKARHESDTLSGSSVTLQRAISTMLAPDSPSTDATDAARLYRRLCGRRPRTITTHQQLDPLCARYGLHVASPETRLQARALHALQTQDDPLFAALFWQYFRFRVRVFRWLTYEPGTSGLDWFSTFNDRLYLFADSIDADLPKLSAQHANVGLSLGAFEARTTFWSPPVASSISSALRWFARGAIAAQTSAQRQTTKQPLEVGMTLHFVKSTVDPRSRKRWDAPRAGVSTQWAGWIQQALTHARSVSRLFAYSPEMLVLLRGIDLCGRELSMPAWPAILPFVHLRRASRKASAWLAAALPEWAVPPLFVTVHAGEDFRRSVEGLRRVHEWIDAGILEPGDRIGHGVSLGEAPEHRTPEGARTLQPAMDRLDDLLWEFDLYSRGSLQAPPGRAVFVEQEILRLARMVYGAAAGAIPVAEHVRARRLRFVPSQIRRALGYARPPSSRWPASGAPWLLAQYFEDELVFAHGERTIEVLTTAAELAFARDAQRMLRADIASKQITVESNPSSNLLIADIASLNDHPALSLQPLPGQSASGPPVLLSINSDDPVVFATSLADEFAHIYYALVRRGTSAQDAVQWIDRVRANGYRSRFTVKASADTAVLQTIIGARSKNAAS